MLPANLPYVSEYAKGVVCYYPHRVVSQIGLDQGVLEVLLFSTDYVESSLRFTTAHQAMLTGGALVRITPRGRVGRCMPSWNSY